MSGKKGFDHWEQVSWNIGNLNGVMEILMGLRLVAFLVQRVTGQGLEQRESIKTVLSPLIIIILISYIIIKTRTIPAETKNGTFSGQCCQLTFCPQCYKTFLYIIKEVSK